MAPVDQVALGLLAASTIQTFFILVYCYFAG
jgi:hypothetical protein